MVGLVFDLYGFGSMGSVTVILFPLSIFGGHLIGKVIMTPVFVGQYQLDRHFNLISTPYY
jgi:hypothetical protein